MTMISVYLSEEDDVKVNFLASEWKLSKMEAIRKLIKDFNDKNYKEVQLQ